MTVAAVAVARGVAGERDAQLLQLVLSRGEAGGEIRHTFLTLPREEKERRGKRREGTAMAARRIQQDGFAELHKDAICT